MLVNAHGYTVFYKGCSENELTGLRTAEPRVRAGRQRSALSRPSKPESIGRHVKVLRVPAT